MKEEMERENIIRIHYGRKKSIFNKIREGEGGRKRKHTTAIAEKL